MTLNNTNTPPALQYVVYAALAIGALLLVAPFAPPQAAVFGAVAILVLGVTGYFAITLTANILYETADNALPEIPDEFDDHPVDNDIVTEYVEGDMTDEQFEQEVETALKNE